MKRKLSKAPRKPRLPRPRRLVTKPDDKARLPCNPRDARQTNMFALFSPADEVRR